MFTKRVIEIKKGNKWIIDAVWTNKTSDIMSMLADELLSKYVYKGNYISRVSCNYGTVTVYYKNLVNGKTDLRATYYKE